MTPRGDGHVDNTTLIVGERVFLRHPRAEDRDEFLSLRHASRKQHQPWEPLPAPGTDPLSDAFARFLGEADTPSSQKHLVCRTSDGAIVGYVGLSQIHLGVFCSCYMGYWTGTPYMRQGYATAGISATVHRAFTSLGLHRVEANIIPSNKASLTVIQRCSFRREGFSPRYLKIAGEWRDHERWALTKEDWETSQKQIKTDR